MSKTNINDTVFERIIIAVKKTCECDSEGYRVHFDTFSAALSKDEVMRSTEELKRIKINTSNIFQFCGKQNQAIILVVQNWLYLKPLHPVASVRMKEDARRVIEKVRKQYSNGKSGKTLIPLNVLEEEMSKKIVFFEYYLRKNNLTPKEFIQSLVKVVPNPEAEKKKDENKKTVGEENETQTADGNHSGGRSGQGSDTYQNILNSMSKSVFSKLIADIIEKQGELQNGVRKIPMGRLCVELHQSSPTFTAICSKYEGMTRDFLTSRFGYMLSIESIEGVEWVSLLQSEKAVGKKETGSDKKAEIRRNISGENSANTMTDQEEGSLSSDSGLSSEEADERVREDIIRIMEQHGEMRDGSTSMVLGELVNELNRSSAAYGVAKSCFKGPARNYLLTHFGEMLSIVYVDGKDRVRIDNSSEKFLTIPGTKLIEAEKHEQKPLPDVSETIDAAQVNELAAQQSPVNQLGDSLVDELLMLADDELVKLRLLMQLVLGIWGDNIRDTEIRKLSKKNAKEQEPEGFAGIADRIGVDALDLFSRNEKLMNLLSGRSVDWLVGILDNELRTRNKDIGAPLQLMEKEKAVVDPVQFDQEVLTEEDYRGLDEWFPF